MVAFVTSSMNGKVIVLLNALALLHKYNKLIAFTWCWCLLLDFVALFQITQDKYQLTSPLSMTISTNTLRPCYQLSMVTVQSAINHHNSKRLAKTSLIISSRQQRSHWEKSIFTHQFTWYNRDQSLKWCYWWVIISHFWYFRFITVFFFCGVSNVTYFINIIKNFF